MKPNSSRRSMITLQVNDIHIIAIKKHTHAMKVYKLPGGEDFLVLSFTIVPIIAPGINHNNPAKKKLFSYPSVVSLSYIFPFNQNAAKTIVIGTMDALCLSQTSSSGGGQV